MRKLIRANLQLVTGAAPFIKQRIANSFQTVDLTRPQFFYVESRRADVFKCSVILNGRRKKPNVKDNIPRQSWNPCGPPSDVAVRGGQAASNCI